ncbi:GNAT family N-acetyltransferase [Halomonas sp. MCCC 1A17488]|uniref:GNAT family N-acetyltransferase n=1 Tax=Billgrantia sulfidoxydans TaxID=2733484 RepID=A0ABX7W0K6_9GAMM|nr:MULTISPECIES: GNAT family N-acetyltransferase [Halomonas]MCE8016417.1 GNAT family N-acetyltransferase [Halomonas sp. MCCC 1A17488]MCG3239750.1 GNAT family N-acetyltransferase [Halomonas sp. MCCC 1A17488]QPP50346.1 GNAT family N-acetyltransferase [Halomonas sp. SS10-MC5]QTP53963.1 GNAT family N-acetyltransferase [Halomonas sulfidoxydans]
METMTTNDAPTMRSGSPRILYRQAKARDAADQAEVFHHAVMQGAAAHYSVAEREAWAATMPREGSVWAARQALYTTLMATCDGRCVGFLELDLPKGHVQTLYVWPSLARRGIGSTLLVHAERMLLEHGHGHVTLDASRMLAESLLRRGWQDLGVEWVTRGGVQLERRRLEKRLTAIET